MAQSSSSSAGRVSRSTSSATSGGNKRRKASGPGKSSNGRSSSSSSSGGSLGGMSNLPQLIERFGSEDKCHEYLAKLRWSDGVKCPRCESQKISRIIERRQFQCESCRYQFSVRVGTIFEDSKLPLWKWFLAAYLMVESRKGISANQIKRMLGVTYKTAWYLCHRIRAAMRDETPEQLSGIVEVDETFIGGRKHGTGQGYPHHKALVLGATERGGNIRLRVAKVRDRNTLHGFVKTVVSDDAEAIMTDEWQAYRGIADEDTRHETVYHGGHEYVRGDVHTNTVESVWSLFKRSIVGSYHQLSVKHLPAYLDEMTFRFNNRENPFLFRDTLKELVTADRLRYRNLVSHSDTR